MSSMKDFVHKCVVCDELCYEVDADYTDFEQENKNYALYKCGSCNFEWEVISCGEQGSL